MKIIGKKSLSLYVSYVLFIIFFVCAVHFLYTIIGHSILTYKFKTGSQIFSQTFILNNDVGWTQNKWTIPMKDLLKFRINYPFTDLQVSTGVFGSTQIIYNIIGMLFVTLFFYFSYRSFKEMSSDKIFNPNAIKWLQRFGYLNLIFGILSLVEGIGYNKITTSSFFQFFFLVFLGSMVLFIVAFFKKGYELQSENDLTI